MGDDRFHEQIVKAVRELAPGASWALVGFDLDSIQWHDENIPRPTDEQILAKIAEQEKSNG
jgi:hypothetical protein